jgi:hypothetical protein
MISLNLSIQIDILSYLKMRLALRFRKQEVRF